MLLKNLLRHGFRIFPALLIVAHLSVRLCRPWYVSAYGSQFFLYIWWNFRSVSYIFLQADNDMSDFDYLEWGTGLQYQTALSWLSFLLYYQQGHSRSEENNWLIERQAQPEHQHIGYFSSFKISNQIRYEYRFTPDWNDYRIKIRWRYPVRTFFCSPIWDGNCFTKTVIKILCSTE